MPQPCVQHGLPTSPCVDSPNLPDAYAAAAAAGASSAATTIAVYMVIRCLLTGCILGTVPAQSRLDCANQCDQQGACTYSVWTKTGQCL
jgi:hypothetical protein